MKNYRWTIQIASTGAVLVSTGTAALTEKVCRRKHHNNA